MTNEERFKLIREALFYMFPDTLHKWAKKKSISHLREGSLKADMTFLEALSDRGLLFEVVWRQYEFNESCREIRKRREARISGGKAKAEKRKLITTLIEDILESDQDAKAPELWPALIGALENEGYQYREYVQEDGTAAVDYWKDEQEPDTCRYGAFKTAITRLRPSLKNNF